MIPAKMDIARGGRRSPSRARWPELRTVSPTLAGICGALAVWTIGHLLAGSRLPSPARVFETAYDSFLSSHYFEGIGLPPGGFLPHLISTTRTTLIGCVLGSVLGAVSGLLSAHSRTVFQITRPIFGILGTIPILVAAPFFLIWFGVSDDAKMFLVSFYSAVVVHVFAYRAVENLSPLYSQYGQTLGAGRFDRFIHISVPGSIPEIFGGFRTALGAAWGLTAITELLGTDRGIGRIITASWEAQDITSMMAGLLLLSLIAVTADWALLVVRNRTLAWARRSV